MRTDLNNVCVSSKKNFVFTDIDLDGAMSYLMMEWAMDKQLPYISTRITDFRQSFANWIKAGNLKKYDTVYILDLDVSSECLEVVDKPNVVIIDHHDSHVRNAHKYKHAKTFIQSETSCARLIYKLLAPKYTGLSPEQKMLVLMVDDYDSYKLKVPGSHELNLLFWNYQGDKLIKFVKDFRDGFNGFTTDQQSIIEFYKTKIRNTINALEYYSADVQIGGSGRKIIATFADTCINDVAEYIIKKHNADIGIVVNPKSQKVSFRKNKKCDVDLSVVASTIADGGGHEYAAGGVLGDKFETFSKLLKPIAYE